MELSADDVIVSLGQQVADLSVSLAVEKAKNAALAKRLAECPCEDCPVRAAAS